MNAALWNAHLETLELKRQIRTLQKQLNGHPPAGRCIYCGTPIRNRRRVCTAHTDLPQLDSGYHG